jgi:hypothetical protein
MVVVGCYKHFYCLLENLQSNFLANKLVAKRHLLKILLKMDTFTLIPKLIFETIFMLKTFANFICTTQKWGQLCTQAHKLAEFAADIFWDFREDLKAAAGARALKVAAVEVLRVVEALKAEEAEVEKVAVNLIHPFQLLCCGCSQLLPGHR